MKIHAITILILSILLSAAANAGEQQAPPLPRPVDVSVGPLPSYPQVAVSFTGFRISEDQRSADNMKAEFTRPIFPAPGQPLAYQISVTAHGGGRKVRVTGAIRDYLEKEIRQVDEELSAADGQTSTRDVAFTPSEDQQGPFFFISSWKEAGCAAHGDLPQGGPEKSWPIAVAIPAARFPVEDFECVRYPEPNAPLENSPAARHTGQMGMIVRPQVPEKQPPPKEGEQPVARQSVPVHRQLPGRPVRIGLLAKASAPARITLQVRDPGIEVGQSPRYERWAIGPIDVKPGDWSPLVFPAPGYGPPKWQRTTRGLLGSGFVDYPLTVETLEIESAPGTTVMVDEMDVFTQRPREGLVRMAPVLDKPAGLLYSAGATPSSSCPTASSADSISRITPDTATATRTTSQTGRTPDWS